MSNSGEFWAEWPTIQVCSGPWNFTAKNQELDSIKGWVPKNWYLQTVMLEKTLESCLDSKEMQSILKEINPEYTLEELMLKLKHQHLATWYKELTHWKRPWCWERLRARGEGDNRGWDRGRHHRLNGHKFEQTQGDSEGWWNLAAAIHRIAKSQTGFSDWTTTRSRNNKDGGDRTIKGLISNFFYGNCQGLS